MTLINAETISVVNGSAIILDTNASIEGYSHPTEFSTLLDELTQADCALTTIEAVRLEFLSKNKSSQELAKKVNFYKE